MESSFKEFSSSSFKSVVFIEHYCKNCVNRRTKKIKVPGEIENPVFWMRYFYKVRQMKLLVRCKADTEKQLLQDEKNEGTQEQKWLKDFEKDDLC